MARAKKRAGKGRGLLVAAVGLTIAGLFIARALRRPATPRLQLEEGQGGQAQEHINGEEREELERLLRQKVKPAPR